MFVVLLDANRRAIASATASLEEDGAGAVDGVDALVGEFGVDITVDRRFTKSEVE